MTRAEIVTGILTGNFDREDLNAIRDALKNAYDMTGMRNRAGLEIGDTVEFRARKLGVVRGTVWKLLRKNVEVKLDGPGFQPIYRCSPSILKKVG